MFEFRWHNLDGRSGKTFTMIGTKERPGLMSLLTQSLYQKISMDQYQVQLSYLEIYNEVIRDLLSPSGGVLDLMEDDKGNIKVPGLSTVRAPNLTRIMQILQEGNLRRTQEATEANKTSSRSHALLQVQILKNNRPHSKLFLIDLAGSERASNTNNRGQRLKEGAAINRSLLALGNVTRNRPGSADQPYTEAMKEMRQEFERRTMKHAASTNQSFYLILIHHAHQMIRERLMKANQDAYEVEMSRTSKMAIIHAWEKHNQEEKAAESINRLKQDVTELDEQLNGMVEIRQKLERALRKGQDTARAVETRLRSLAHSKEQSELIDLIVRMDNIQAERKWRKDNKKRKNVQLRNTEHSEEKQKGEKAYLKTLRILIR
ncbi:kinesin motor domain protein [Teladorsagia circumcincta]|uniref:Kinesin-like protein n=2 Tax=Teladorsagia circumcincta TaxID=45464 RepID=A0A2G9U9T2_TELCI|nr:kinesin motor domain protein [Teladorsagia circumcincta]